MLKKIFNNKIFIGLFLLFLALIIELSLSNAKIMLETNGKFINYDIDENNIIYSEETIILNESIIQKKENIFSLDIEEDNETIEVRKTSISVEIDCENKYISKLKLNYKTNEDTAKSIIYQTYDEYGNPKKENDYISFETELDFVVKPIKNKIDKIIIPLNYNETDLKISSIEVINSFSFNIYRFIVILSIMTSLFLIYSFRKKVQTNLEIFFLIICIGTGFSMIVATPTLLRYSWDDHIHFDKIYSMFDYDKTCKTDSYNYIMKSRAMQVNIPESFEENLMLDNYLNNNNQCTTKNTESFGFQFISYDNFTYIPSAIVIKICKIANVPFSISFRLGKLINLLIYSIIGYITIKKAKYGKKILFILLLLPTNIFLASQYSKDSYITALLALGISTFMNCYTSKNKLSTKQLSLIIISIVLGSLSKLIYIPFILLLLMFSKKKFSNTKKSTIIKILVILLFFIIFILFASPSASSSSVVSDIRGGDNTSSFKQLSLILSQPISFLKVFIPHFRNIFIDYFISNRSLIVFCNLGIISGNIYYYLLFLLIFVALTGEKNKIKIPTKIKVTLILIIALVISFIIGSMYLSFNNVASISIKGVQQRYFLPLFYPFLLLLNNNKITTKFKEKNYNYFIIFSMMLVLYYSVFMLIIKTCCI